MQSQGSKSTANPPELYRPSPPARCQWLPRHATLKDSGGGDALAVQSLVLLTAPLSPFALSAGGAFT